MSAPLLPKGMIGLTVVGGPGQPIFVRASAIECVEVAPYDARHTAVRLQRWVYEVAEGVAEVLGKMVDAS